MVIKNVELSHVVGVTTKELPDVGLPEIAFAGRSNVGKSSLINAIIQRKSFARTSSTPGKTQTMNFYRVNDDVCFVDLPGYGYAKVNVDYKRSWGPMIERYLNGSPNLRAVFLLIDIRRIPNEDDSMMYEWMVNAGFSPVVIVTKADKAKKSEVKKAMLSIKNALRITGDTDMYLFSALKKTGRDDIMHRIDEIIYEGGFEDDED